MSESDSIILPLRTCTRCDCDFPASSEYFNRQPAGKYGLSSWCKGCQSAYRHGHYMANRAKALAQRAVYAAAHREEYAAYKRAYDEAHREEKAEWSHTYYLEHRDEIVEKTRVYRAATPEKQAERRRAYQAAHPGNDAAHKRKRRTTRSGGDGTHTAADVQSQHARQKGRCFYCGVKVGDDYHVDHVIPLTKGGSNGPENLVIACPPCNRAKGAKDPMDFAGIFF